MLKKKKFSLSVCKKKCLSASPRVKKKTWKVSCLSVKNNVIIFQKTRSTSSPSKSSLDGLDMKTAELQQRAKMLLEKRFDCRQIYTVILRMVHFTCTVHHQYKLAV